MSVLDIPGAQVALKCYCLKLKGNNWWHQEILVPPGNTDMTFCNLFWHQESTTLSTMRIQSFEDTSLCKCHAVRKILREAGQRGLVTWTSLLKLKPRQKTLTVTGADSFAQIPAPGRFLV